MCVYTQPPQHTAAFHSQVAHDSKNKIICPWPHTRPTGRTQMTNQDTTCISDQNSYSISKQQHKFRSVSYGLDSLLSLSRGIRELSSRESNACTCETDWQMSKHTGCPANSTDKLIAEMCGPICGYLSTPALINKDQGSSALFPASTTPRQSTQVFSHKWCLEDTQG